MSLRTHLLILLIGIFPAGLFTVFLHEAGHFLVGRLLGYTVTSWGLGAAPPCLFSLRFGNTYLYQCMVQPFQGFTWVIPPVLYPSRRTSALLLLAGIGANLLATLIFGVLWRLAPPSSIVSTLLVQLTLLNATVALVNAFPLSGRLASGARIRSDGANLLPLLRRIGNHRRVQSPAALLSLRPLWNAVGDRAVLKYHLLLAVENCLEIGDTELAQRYQEEALTLPSPPLSEGYFYLLQGIILTVSEQSDTSVTPHFNGARHIFEVRGDTFGTLRTLLLAAPPAERLTFSLPNNAPLALESELAALKVLAALETGKEETEVETHFARFQATRSRYRADTLDLKVFLAIAHFREAHRYEGGASLAYEQALSAAQAIYIALTPDPEARTRFAQRQHASLAKDFAACLRRLQKNEDAAQIEAFFDETNGSKMKIPWR